MSTQQKTQLSVSPEMIKLLGEKLYTSHTSVIVTRELVQNAIDAVKMTKNAKNRVVIEYFFDSYSNKYHLTVKDQGVGMSEFTLTQVFLTLGLSGKRNSESVTGGFGIAKASIFSCQSWEVYTREKGKKDFLYVSDVTLGESVQKIPVNIAGYADFNTVVRVTVKDTYAYTKNAILRMILDCNSQVKMTLIDKNEETKRYLTYKKPKYQFVIAHNSNLSVSGYRKRRQDATSKIIYRLNGLVQYLEYLGDSKDDLFIDVFTTFSPISNEYPFSMSRERIQTNSDWYSTIRSIIQGMQKDTLQSNDEDTKNPVGRPVKPIEFYFSGKPENYQINAPNRSKLYNVKSKNLTLLYANILYIFGKRDFKVTLISDEETHGYNESGFNFGINPDSFANFNDSISLVLAVYSLALHELSHDVYTYHDEKFTSHMAEKALTCNPFFSRYWKSLMTYAERSIK